MLKLISTYNNFFVVSFNGGMGGGASFVPRTANARCELMNVKPMAIENLPADVRELVQAYLRARPKSFAARMRPRFGLDEDQWYVLYGPNMRTGITGFGATVTSALATWEANYREATTAER